MLFAELHGKLGRDGSRAHDRAEDLLTSTAFQLLRYLPLGVGLLAVLRRVRDVAPDGRVLTTAPPWLKLEVATEARYTARYTFWPHWGEHGQPDVVVELLVDGLSLGWFVIEVKLEASKSGAASDEDDEDTDAEVSPDQLHKYWQGLKAQFGDKRLGIVYLTSHIVPPAEELTASVSREPGDWLGWLSWRDVWAAVRTSDELAARDLAAILAAKGLKGFDGFHSRPWRLPKQPRRFWTKPPQSWFSQAPRQFPTKRRFWNLSGDHT